MKKTFTLFLTMITIAFTGCAPQALTNSDIDRERMLQKTDLSMPKPFDISCGDINNTFFLPCINRFDNVTTDLCDLVDYEALQQWIDIMNSNETPCDIEDYINIYSFMVYFDISTEEVCRILEESNEFYLDKIGDNPDSGLWTIIYTDYELDALRTGDKEIITAQFAADLSIVFEDKIYSPNWVYYHTTEDYAACGITAEMLSETASEYSAINFTAEAREALESKLSDFAQTAVSLE